MFLSKSFIRRCYSKKASFIAQSSYSQSHSQNQTNDTVENENTSGAIGQGAHTTPFVSSGAYSNVTPKIQQYKSFQVKSLVHLQKQNDDNHGSLGILQNKHIIETKPVVVILAADKHNHIMILHTNRSASLEEKEKLLELPHFELNKNDDPREKIHEELAKFGLNTQNSIIHPVNDYYTMPHFSSQQFFVYLVQNCDTDGAYIEEKPHLHPISSVYLEWLPPKKVKQLIENGLIHDAKTGVALSQIILHYYFTSPGFFSLGKIGPLGLGLILGAGIVYFFFLSSTSAMYENSESLSGGKEYEEATRAQMRKSGHL